MFGISLPKVLFTLAVIAVVYWVGRRLLPGKSRSATRASTSTSAHELNAEQCSICGDYVSLAGRGTCGRTDCPQA